MSHTATSRRERRKQEVHDRILSAAASLFECNRIAETTALAIADTADVAEKTFYNHFPTKQHLVTELAEGVVAETLHLLAEALEQEGSTRERIASFAEQSGKRADASGPIRRALILEIIRVSQVESVSPSDDVSGGLRRDLHDAWGALLRRGVAQGDVGDRYSVGFLTDLAVAAFGGVATRWAACPDYPIRERLAECAACVGDAVEARRHAPNRDETHSERSP